MKNSFGAMTRHESRMQGDAMRTWVTTLARRRRRKAILMATQAIPVRTERPRTRTRRATEAALFDGIVQSGRMGSLGGRPFYSHAHLPGRDLALPFGAGPFSCFVHLGVHAGDETLSTLAHMLLHHGLYAVYCAGVGCERLGEIFDAILDDGAYFHGDAAVTAMVLEDESIDQAIEYFSLPSGHDAPHLLLTLGTSEHHQQTLDAFSSAMDRMKLAFCG